MVTCFITHSGGVWFHPLITQGLRNVALCIHIASNSFLVAPSRPRSLAGGCGSKGLTIRKLLAFPCTILNT